MPIRKTLLVTGEIYHIYNKSVAQEPIFESENCCSRILELINYYRFKDNPLRFSHYSRLSVKKKKKYLSSLNSSASLIKIFSFSVMPNHYHFLLRQEQDSGIIDFIRLLQGSYARYFNTKTKRSGSVFQNPFKGIRIESEEQFLHLSRYVHLNQLTFYVLKNPEDLKDCKLNSFTDYISDNPRPFIEKTTIMGLFKNKRDFQDFVFDRLNYQRNLQKIRHLVLEE